MSCSEPTGVGASPTRKRSCTAAPERRGGGGRARRRNTGREYRDDLFDPERDGDQCTTRADPCGPASGASPGECPLDRRRLNWEMIAEGIALQHEKPAAEAGSRFFAIQSHSCFE